MKKVLAFCVAFIVIASMFTVFASAAEPSLGNSMFDGKKEVDGVLVLGVGPGKDFSGDVRLVLNFQEEMGLADGNYDVKITFHYMATNGGWWQMKTVKNKAGDGYSNDGKYSGDDGFEQPISWREDTKGDWKTAAVSLPGVYLGDRDDTKMAELGANDDMMFHFVVGGGSEYIIIRGIEITAGGKTVLWGDMPKAPDTRPDPDPTPDPDPIPDTGDYTMIFGLAAIAVAAGAVLTIGKKKR